MTTTSDVPYEWLKSIDPELAEIDTIPLLGMAPEFPWGQFSEILAKTFEIESLKVAPGELRWRQPDELYGDLGDQVYIQKVTLSSFKGEVAAVFDREDLKTIIYTLMNKAEPTELQIYDEEIEKGLYRFLALEAVRAFSESGFDSTLSLHLLEDQSLNEEAALGLDVNIALMGRTFGVRLLIFQEFQHAWNEHYAERSIDTPVSQDLLDKLETTVHLKIGEAVLSRDELKSLKEGDFMLLEQCTYDPSSQKGEAVLTLNGSPKVRGSLENRRFTVQKTPLFHEDIALLAKEKGEKEP